MAAVFPWYSIVNGEELEQGDLLTNCKLVLQTADLVTTSDGVATIDGHLITYDIVILTQSCDLDQAKVDYVVVCPHWDLREAQKTNAALAKSGVIDQIRKRQMPRYAMIAACEISEMPMAVRIVDFGQVFSVPRAYLTALARHEGNRLRLLPPYREHVAQAFASFFMRVGLPNDIKLT